MTCAIQDYDVAIERFPQFPQTYVDRGDAYYMSDEYERAIEDYDAAIGLDGDNAYSYYSRGWAHLSQGSMSKARADFEKALELGHDREDIVAALATLKQLEEDG